MSRRDTALEVASHIPVPIRVLTWRSAVNCIVFVAHAVVDEAPPPHLAHIIRCKTSARFETDLRWLGRHFQFVEYKDVQSSIEDAHPL
ncbi:MAG TPA: hypothetical protein VJ787_10170, partial [Thermoleophilia bacterium]|nr:hypothetical protein [Thermoleophilia bacterium]